MKKLDTRLKRYLTIGGSTLICVGAVALILTNGAGAAAGQAAEPLSSAPTSTEVSVPEIKVISQESSSEASAFVPSSGASAAASLTTISKPTSAPPEPTPPASAALTDKNKKPSYSSKPVVSKKSASRKPSGGKPGQEYVPGFGWQYPTGGEGTVVSGMHEGGEQVGIMD